MNCFAKDVVVSSVIERLSLRERSVILFLHHACRSYNFKLVSTPYATGLVHRLEVLTPDYKALTFSELYVQVSPEWLLKEALSSEIQLWIAPFVEGLWMVRAKSADGHHMEVIGPNMMDSIIKTAIAFSTGVLDQQHMTFDFIET
jgi:hypothetical protein